MRNVAHMHLPIVSLRSWKPLDRLYLLWTLCFIAHRQERNESISMRAIIDDFGKDVHFIFQTYIAAAEDQKMLDAYHMKLTPKGERVVAHWQEINQRLYAV